MSEATLVGEVATALEPFAAQALEDLHAYVSGEITRLEAEMPDAVDHADSSVKYYVGDLKTVLHKFVAKLDETRGGASTEPAQVEQLPEGQSAEPVGPAVGAPNGTQITDAVPPTQPSASTPPPSNASPTPVASPAPTQLPGASSAAASSSAAAAAKPGA